MKCGTPNYIDPYILDGNLYTPQSDIYSLGSTLYTLLTNSLLLNSGSNAEVLLKNHTGDTSLSLENKGLESFSK